MQIGNRARRREVQFERRPSQRHARRQSHVLREKDRGSKFKKSTSVSVSAASGASSAANPVSSTSNAPTTIGEVKKSEATAGAIAVATLVEPIEPTSSVQGKDNQPSKTSMIFEFSRQI